MAMGFLSIRILFSLTIRRRPCSFPSQPPGVFPVRQPVRWVLYLLMWNERLLAAQDGFASFERRLEVMGLEIIKEQDGSLWFEAGLEVRLMFRVSCPEEFLLVH